MPSRLVRLTLAGTAWVLALAREIVLRPWARHFTLTVPLSTQVYKWEPANLILDSGNLTVDQHPIQEGVEIFLRVASCYRNRDKLVCRLYLATFPTRP